MISEMPKWFRLAKIAASKSDYRYKVGAVLVKGGSVLASGCNDVRYRQIGTNQYSEWKESLHAERAVISKFNKDELKGCSIYIWRNFNDRPDQPAMSKPCSQCARLIADVGIKKVYYTIPDYPYYEEIRL